MQLIVIHGAPAVGKLTIAKELAQKTGYKVFHNHLTIDLVTSLFDRSQNMYWTLNRSFRLQMIEAAAQENLPGVIFTYGYTPIGQIFIDQLFALCKKYKVTTYFVYITCLKEEQLKRVEEESRKCTGKIQTKELLLYALDTIDFKKIPDVESLEIDSTNLPPEAVANKIIEQFNLPTA